MRTGSRFTHSDAIILILMAGVALLLWWQFPLFMAAVCSVPGGLCIVAGVTE